MKILIINGPNLNLLGKREPEVYGNTDFDAYFQNLNQQFPQAELTYYQSNVEGEIINKLHEVGFSHDAILLNAGGYTHTSVAISDAIKAIETPVLEIHVSNIHSREEYRHKSLISGNCIGMISGLGLEGYLLGIAYFLNQNQ